MNVLESNEVSGRSDGKRNVQKDALVDFHYAQFTLLEALHGETHKPDAPNLLDVDLPEKGVLDRARRWDLSEALDFVEFHNREASLRPFHGRSHWLQRPVDVSESDVLLPRADQRDLSEFFDRRNALDLDHRTPDLA